MLGREGDKQTKKTFPFLFKANNHRIKCHINILISYPPLTTTHNKRDRKRLLVHFRMQTSEVFKTSLQSGYLCGWLAAHRHSAFLKCSEFIIGRFEGDNGHNDAVTMKMSWKHLMGVNCNMPSLLGTNNTKACDQDVIVHISQHCFVIVKISHHFYFVR